MKKILSLLLVFNLLFLIFPIDVFAENSIPAMGEKQTVDITWSRTSESGGKKSLPVASWNWSDVSNINYSETANVWDGGSIAGNSGDAYRPWDFATWKSNRSTWNGTADVRRFRGEFNIPEGYTPLDKAAISSVGDYRKLDLYNIFPINDNIFIFIYPKNQEINDNNFMEYFVFWGGTAGQDLATQANKGPVKFHGEPCPIPYEYTYPDAATPKLLSHTAGWYCYTQRNNIDNVMNDNSNVTEFVIDVFVEDFANIGGMDRLNLTFTKTTEGVPGSPSPENGNQENENQGNGNQENGNQENQNQDKITYSVSYNGNGNDSGTVPTDAEGPYFSGETVMVRPPSALTKSGYRFLGWNTKADGTGDYYTLDENGQLTPPYFTLTAGDVVLYAQWERLRATDGEELVADIPIDYPPDYVLVPKDDTVEVLEADGSLIGSWIRADGLWTYQATPNSSQLVPQADGTLEVVAPDDTPIGLWSKNQDDEWVYEDYMPEQSSWLTLLGVLLALGILAGLIYYFLIARRRYVTREEFVRMIVNGIHLKNINFAMEIEDIMPYSDVSKNDNYYNAVMSAWAVGLLSKLAGREFRPHIEITREEMAGIIAETMRCVKFPVTLEPINISAVFKDYESINELYLSDVVLVAQLQIMKASPNNEFEPAELSTRKQAKKMLDKLLDSIAAFLPSTTK